MKKSRGKSNKRVGGSLREDVGVQKRFVIGEEK